MSVIYTKIISKSNNNNNVKRLPFNNIIVFSMSQMFSATPLQYGES